MLSIIVPIHNASPWLAAMLDSVYSQDCSEREVILVDDGSTDASAAIINAYFRRHPETRVLRQPNRGVSVARNRGLGAARGEFVAFPDADDLLLPGMYATLLRAARQDCLDLVFCNARFLRDGRACERVCPSLGATAVLSGVDWLRLALAKGELHHPVWSGLYRTSFLRRHGFQFIPGLIYRQDVPWTTEVLTFAQRVRYLEEPLYLYRVAKRAPDPKRWNLIARSYMRVVEVLSEFNRNHAERLAPAMRGLRWQITEQGLRIFHQIRRLPAFADRLAALREMRRRGTDRLIRENAVGYSQKRRVLKRFAHMYLVLALSAFVLPDSEQSNLAEASRSRHTSAGIHLNG
jgi:heptose III glucuronosyltransferase